MWVQARRIPRRRWAIGALLGAGVLVNYFDRINLSVSGPQLQQEFGLTAAEMGLPFSAFFWSYALLQVPTGLVLDRFGVTLTPSWARRSVTTSTPAAPPRKASPTAAPAACSATC
jgi:MFS family permease